MSGVYAGIRLFQKNKNAVQVYKNFLDEKQFW